MSAAGDIGGSRMGGVVVRFERRVASLAVITKLVDFGYLQPGARTAPPLSKGQSTG